MPDPIDQMSSDFLHGSLIAQGALLRSLIAVLPKEALQALPAELERNIELGSAYLLGQNVSDETVETFGSHSNYNLDFARYQLAQKEALGTPGAALRWIQEQQGKDDQQ